MVDSLRLLCLFNCLRVFVWLFGSLCFVYGCSSRLIVIVYVFLIASVVLICLSLFCVCVSVVCLFDCFCDCLFCGCCLFVCCVLVLWCFVYVSCVLC